MMTNILLFIILIALVMGLSALVITVSNSTSKIHQAIEEMQRKQEDRDDDIIRFLRDIERNTTRRNY